MTQYRRNVSHPNLSPYLVFHGIQLDRGSLAKERLKILFKLLGREGILN